MDTISTEARRRRHVTTNGDIDMDTASFLVLFLFLVSPTMLIIAYGPQGLRGLVAAAAVIVPLVSVAVAALRVGFTRFFSLLMCSCSPTAEATDAAATLPAAFRFKRRDAAAMGWAQCIICLVLVRVGDKVRRLPACGHLFHEQCVDRWLHAHATCPLCRATVVVQASSREDLPV